MLWPGDISRSNREPPPVTDRTGTSCGQTVLGIVAFGDSSVQSAKQSAGIQNVATIDRDYFSILGLYGKSCLIVSGN